MIIQYKCLVPIYVFPEMKLLFPKQKFNVLSPSSYTLNCERFIYFQDQSAFSAPGKYVDRSWKYINRTQTLSVEIGTEAAKFPEKEYINGIFLAVCLLAY
jgi:hypothetical protein